MATMTDGGPSWRVVIGSDEAGASYREMLIADLAADERVSEVIDIGVPADDQTPYSEVGIAGAERVAAGDADRGILICGTGIGMAISANKVTGVRATTAHDSFSAERSILSNDAQVLCLGERVIGRELARRLAREWLGYVFDPASHSAAKVDVIERYDRAHGAAEAASERR